MIFPLADVPNPPGRAYATWSLMAINIAVYLLITLPASTAQVDLNDPLLHEYLINLGVVGQVTAQEVLRHISAYDLLVYEYGFRPAEFSPVTLLTSLFMHGGFLHLAGNMLFLFIFGDNVEFRLGRWRYLLAYLGCGITATLFFALFAAGSQIPLIGASGAIYGVLGCYFFWFPRNRVRCFIFLFPFIMTSIYLSARLVLGFYLLIDNLLPFLFNARAGSGIAHGAHIGGFFGGLALAWGMDRFYLMKRGERTIPGEQKGDLSSVEQICPWVSGGNLAAAADCYLGLDSRPQRVKVSAQDALQIGEYLLDQGRLTEALQVFRRFIAERQTAPQIDRAYLGAGKVMLRKPRHTTSAYHYFLAAHDLARSEEVAVEAKAHLRLIEQQQKTAISPS